MSASSSSSVSASSVVSSPVVTDFLSFLNQSPSPFHAVHTSIDMLSAAGFQRLDERDAWPVSTEAAATSSSSSKPLVPGGKYFFTRNDSSIVAFAIGEKWKPGNGFIIQAAHTDSPVLKVKPVSKVTKSGYLSVGVEPYGGGLWNTWFDRDLGLAGRVIIRTSGTDTFATRLVHIRRPILRIPMLAIHLQRDISEKGFNPNKQTHLLPVLATAVQSQLHAPSLAATAAPTATAATTAATDFSSQHHPLLLSLLAAELKVELSQIQDFELVLCDTQPAALGGAFNEFVLSGRLDNLCMSYICTRSLIDSASSLGSESLIRMAALFDNEEVGSGSAPGAASNMMMQLLTRINGTGTINEAVARSLLVSADMAHAVHPNYSEVHEENHRPEMHGGLVIKYNGNQRYATNAITAFPVAQIAAAHAIRTQKFCVRNDSACGSTIGPILAANTGMKTVDVGVPQLAMHSIREMCATTDVVQSHSLLLHIYHEYAAFDSKFKQNAE